jgi:hypothetical protein
MNRMGRGTAAMTAMLGVIAVYVLLLACASALGAVSLPDGRGWEMVSPVDKNGGEINGIDGAVPNEGLPEGGIIQSTEAGDAITYLSLLAFPGSTSNEPLGAPIASQYISRRNADGWVTNNLNTVVNSHTYAPAGSGAPYRAFSSDLSTGLILNGQSPVENPPLTPDAPARYVNYYIRDTQTGSLRALLTSTPAEGPEEFSLTLQGVTPDLRHIVVSSPAALAPEAVAQSEGNLYEWADGKFWPINVPVEPVHPGETAPGHARLGMGFNENRAISSDGTRVIWSQEGSASLFTRVGIGTEHAKTVQIDASHGGADPGVLGEFRTASADGSIVFFTDGERLTPDSTAGGNAHEDLYMFNVETNHLTDLTVDNDPGGASVLGVLEASEDGSYIYFVAKGRLPSTTAEVNNTNLYMWHDGVTMFIGALSNADSGTSSHEPTTAHDWSSSTGVRTARVTAGGRRLLFMSSASLTRYDNRDANTGMPDEEIYLYDATSATLTCVSCNPSGGRPVGPSGFPGGTPWRSVDERGAYQPRVISTDGTRVFFDSKDALSPQDSNNAQDVYEWEQDGTGTCTDTDNCVFLLSGASSTSDSSFVDASTSGDNAFVITRAQLAGQDVDRLRDLYDARIGGGFPVPPPSISCEGESCLPPPLLTPASSAVASAMFSGVGNLSPRSPHPVATSKIKKKSKDKHSKKNSRRRSRRKNVKKVHKLNARRS